MSPIDIILALALAGLFVGGSLALRASHRLSKAQNELSSALMMEYARLDREVKRMHRMGERLAEYSATRRARTILPPPPNQEPK